jgi:D-proline reductase (dithiol) PrdB
MRREDVPARLAERPIPHFDPTQPIPGKPLNQRRIALVSTAGLMHRNDKPFTLGAADYRILDSQSDQDILMSHVSTNFDRSGFVQDLNVVFPIDRLTEKAQAGEIGSVARFHYSFMGATSPEAMEMAAGQLAKNLKNDEVDGLILVPV